MKGFTLCFVLTLCAVMVLGLCSCTENQPITAENVGTPDITAPVEEVTQTPNEETPATATPAVTNAPASTTPEATVKNTPAKTTPKPKATPTPEPYSPRPKDPAELSAEQEQKIKEDYVARYMESLESEPKYEYTVDDVVIKDYFGTYNGGVAMFISFYGLPFHCDYAEIDVAGYIFTYAYSNYLIQFYKDGTFSELSKAYDAGMLTKEDVRDIYWYYMGR